MKNTQNKWSKKLVAQPHYIAEKEQYEKLENHL